MNPFSSFRDCSGQILGFRFSIIRTQNKKVCCRVIIAVLSALSASAQAQQPKNLPRIGYLASFASPASSVGPRQLDAFRQTLRDLGYIEQKNYVLDYRYPKDHPEQVAELATELVRLKVNVVVAQDPAAIRALKKATTTIPIVMVTNQDPVAAGLVQTLARPGGNVTGLTRQTRELSGKRLETIKEVVPSISRVGVLWVRPSALGTGNAFQSYQAVAEALKTQLVSLQVRRPEPKIEEAFDNAVEERVHAMVVVSNAVLSPHMKLIAELAIRNRLPSICEGERYVDAGCLMSYASDDFESFQRAALYVDKILKGAKPADLPIEQPTRFKLVLNLTTAKQLSLTMPQRVLARADRVIR